MKFQSGLGNLLAADWFCWSAHTLFTADHNYIWSHRRLSPV